jgi:hypothetical protein
MASDPEEDFNEQDFYDHAKRAEVYFGQDVSRRHHKAALKDFLHWMDRSGAAKAEQISPGAKAAQQASIPDAQNKELAGRMKIVDESKTVQSDPVPVEDQPKGFDDAAAKAHDIYMSALGKSDEK